ncbi:MAG: hypothetical protein WCS52_12335 [bacterium]|jgi:hypothetical protein
MTTKTLRLSDHMLDAVRELGTAEHIEEATGNTGMDDTLASLRSLQKSNR